VAEPETWEKQLAGTFDTFSENVPMWVWIPWLPQLLAALSRPEGVQLKGVLAKLASLYPQAVYYPLRNFIFEQRLLAYSRSRKKTQLLEAAAAAAAAVHSTGSSEQQQAPPVALQEQPPPPVKEEGDPGTSAQADDKKKRQGLLFGEEVMSIMKNSFPAVVAKMEEMVKEITKCVTISTEERLLQVWQEVWDECNRYANCIAEGLPDAVMAKLCSIRDTAFEPRPDMKEPEKEKLAAKKVQMTQDFCFTNGRCCLTNDQAQAKVKEWLRRVSDEVEGLPPSLNLEELSRYLVGFKSNTIEVPGQYVSFGEPGIDHHVRIDGFEAEVLVSHGGKLSQRCLVLRGSNGKTYPFHLLAQPSFLATLSDISAGNDNGADNRMGQFLRLVNGMLQKNVQTRKRQLNFFLPPMIALSPAVRLVQAEADLGSLAQIYQGDCRRRGVDPDDLFRVYKNRLVEAVAPSATEPQQSSLSVAYHEACRTVVPDTAFSQAIHRSFGAATQLFMFKRQFVTQLALTSFLGHALAVSHRGPSNIYFSRSTANILHLAFTPEFNKASGQLEWCDAVPFRLTRNLQAFCNPLWTEGPLNAAMTALARCLAQPQAQEHLRGFLLLYMRDELAGKFSKDTAAANVVMLMQRLVHLGFFAHGDKQQQQAEDVNKKVCQLLEAATDPNNLAAMDPTWLPPF
jgi:transformation/transcription domain-associated protein